MDDYKKCMRRGMIERPEDYLDYTVGDVEMLLKAIGTCHDQFNTIMRDVLGMHPDDLWTLNDMPMSRGSLVANTVERFIIRQPVGKYVMLYAIKRLGVLDRDAKDYQESRAAWASTREKYKDIESLRDSVRDMRPVYDENDVCVWKPDEDLMQFFKAKLRSGALNASHVKTFAALPPENPACYNALVHGGRCNNEMPFEYYLEDGADIDISGCYGEALRSLHFPVGRSRWWGKSPNKKPRTLGSWLRETEGDLVDNLWTATVSGKLSFEQDLIHSKLVKVDHICRSKEDLDEDGIPADFALLRREITNGIITSDILRAVRAAATNRELKEIMALELVTACAYLKRDRFDSTEGWAAHVIAHPGEHGLGGMEDDSADTRTYGWCSIPLEDFIGKLVDERKKYKRLQREATTAEQRIQAAAMDEMLKLTINTLYGDLVSRFFRIGNTCLGNVITARARMGVWMLAKALGLRQTITDGGFYIPRSVCHWDKCRPGLDTLSRLWEWDDRRDRRRWFDRMPGWEKGMKDLTKLDEIAAEHVRDFWAEYELPLPFSVEHKRTFDRVAWNAKGDYAMENDGDEKPLFKVRGKDKGRSEGDKPHPVFPWFRNILAGSDAVPGDMVYETGSIMKIGMWRHVQRCNQGYESFRDLRPGDNWKGERRARIGNNHFPMLTADDYLRRKNRKRFQGGESVEWFERFADHGTAYMMNKMAHDDLRKDKRK
jgi:hypothetical protein